MAVAKRTDEGGEDAPLTDQQRKARRQIIEAAAGLFEEYGYKGTSMKAIASAVGISAPALYWHFPSKEDILFSYIEPAMRSFVTETKRALTGDNPAERLAQFTAIHVALQIERAEKRDTPHIIHNTGALFQYLSEDRREIVQALNREHFQLCRTIIEQGNRAGRFNVSEVSATALMIIGMCETVAAWYRPGGPLSPHDVGRLHVDAALAIVGLTIEERNELLAAIDIPQPQNSAD